MVKLASGIPARSLGALAHALLLLSACGGHSTKPSSPAEGGAAGETAAPPAGQCSFNQATFTEATARPRFDPPALAEVPGGLLSAWRDDRDVDFGLYVQLLDLDGSVAAGEQRLVAGNEPDSKLSLARSGDAVALAWSDQKRVHVSLLDLKGGLTSQDIWLSSAADFTQAPRLAATAQGWGMVWCEGPGQSESKSRFVLVDSDGAASEPLLLAAASPSAREPQLCSTGQRFGVVWTDRRSGRDEVWFRAIDLAGASLTAERRVGFVVDGQATEASIACTQDGFAVAWNQSGDSALHLQRLDAEGAAVGKASSWPGILSAVGFAGQELRLLRLQTSAAAGAELWLQRVAGGAEAEQQVAEQFGGGALRLPLVEQAGRSYLAWSQDDGLRAASIDCP